MLAKQSFLSKNPTLFAKTGSPAQKQKIGAQMNLEIRIRFAFVLGILVCAASGTAWANSSLGNLFLYSKGKKVVLIAHQEGKLLDSWGISLKNEPAQTPSLALTLGSGSRVEASVCLGSTFWQKSADMESFAKKTMDPEIDSCRLLSGKQSLSLLVRKRNGWQFVNSQSLRAWTQQKDGPFPAGVPLDKWALKKFHWDWPEYGSLAVSDQNMLVGLREIQGKLETIELGNISEESTVAARGNQVLIQEDGAAEIREIPENREIGAIGYSVLKLPVFPCDEGERCTGSVGEDRTWFLCGSWGCYLGQKERSLRVPAISTRNPVVLHNSAKGSFLLLGQDDSELAPFPPNDFENLSIADTNPQNWVRRGRQGGARAGRPPSVHESTQVSDDESNEARPNFQDWDSLDDQHPSQRHVFWTRPNPSLSANKETLECLNTNDMDFLFEFQAPGGTSLVFSEKRPKFPNSGLRPAAFNPKQVSNLALSCGLPPIVAWEVEVEHRKLDRNPAAETRQGFFTEKIQDIPEWHKDLSLEMFKEALRAKGALSSVKVGIIDSGIDTMHPDFPVWEGRDFVEEDTDPQDEFGHGTHVAGILLGKAYGVADNAKLFVAKALDSRGGSNSLDLARAMGYLLQSGSQVVNCSWGGGASTQVLRDAFAAAAAKGVLTFTSAGNDGLNLDTNPTPPKSFPGVIATGSWETGNPQRKARFSNIGPKTLSFLAPGTDILSALRNGTWGNMSGTSMSSPMTAGTAALLLGAGVGASQIPDILCKGATPRPNWASCGQLNPLESWKIWQAEQF